ncbi:hypothetical protein D3C76_524180 [compost metagenome]
MNYLFLYPSRFVSAFLLDLLMRNHCIHVIPMKNRTDPTSVLMILLTRSNSPASLKSDRNINVAHMIVLTIPPIKLLFLYCLTSPSLLGSRHIPSLTQRTVIYKQRYHHNHEGIQPILKIPLQNKHFYKETNHEAHKHKL